MIAKVTEVIRKNESQRLIRFQSTPQDGKPAYVQSEGEMYLHVAHGELHAGDLLEIKKVKPVIPQAATKVATPRA